MVATVDSAVDEIKGWLGDNVTGGSPVERDYLILENGVLTSMQTVELVLFLEERFGISVEEEEFVEENFASINQIAAYVGSKTA